MLSTLPALIGCATPALPPSCAGLRGIRTVPIEDASGTTRIRYTYANEAVRLPHLQCRADQGERAAIMELARALETGDGVTRDDARAASFYEKAAQDRPAFTSIYSPPVRLSGAGQVLMIPNPDGGPGSAEAKYRLGRMLVEGRGVGTNVERGQDLIAAAERQGFQPKFNATSEPMASP